MLRTRVCHFHTRRLATRVPPLVAIYRTARHLSSDSRNLWDTHNSISAVGSTLKVVFEERTEKARSKRQRQTPSLSPPRIETSASDHEEEELQPAFVVGSGSNSSQSFFASELGEKSVRVFDERSEQHHHHSHSSSEHVSHYHGTRDGPFGDYEARENTSGRQKIPVSKFAEIDSGKVLRFLKSHGIEFRDNAFGEKVEVKICPFCHDTKNDRSNFYKLCIFLQRGNFNCLRCGAHGSFYDFQNRFSSISVEQVHRSPTSRGSEGGGGSSYRPDRKVETVHNVRMDSIKLQDPVSHAALDFLTKERGISLEVLELYQVGARDVLFFSQDKKEVHTCVTFPSIHGNVVPRIKVRSISDKKNQRCIPAGSAPGFFGWHTIPNDAKSVIITEGEFDAMAAFQGTGLAAISLPNGARSMPVELIPCLERFEKIYLWLDDDATGQEGADKIAKKLGLSRCFVVRCRGTDVNGPKDANDVLKKGGDMKELINKASRLKHKQIAMFHDIRDDIFLELVEGNKMNGVPYQTLPRLTSIIKGHRKGELTILTGATGVGKTTVSHPFECFEPND
jgi:twinkle protein